MFIMFSWHFQAMQLIGKTINLLANLHMQIIELFALLLW